MRHDLLDSAHDYEKKINKPIKNWNVDDLFGFKQFLNQEKEARCEPIPPYSNARSTDATPPS